MFKENVPQTNVNESTEKKQKLTDESEPDNLKLILYRDPVTNTLKSRFKSSSKDDCENDRNNLNKNIENTADKPMKGIKSFISSKQSTLIGKIWVRDLKTMVRDPRFLVVSNQIIYSYSYFIENHVKQICFLL